MLQLNIQLFVDDICKGALLIHEKLIVNNFFIKMKDSFLFQ